MVVPKGFTAAELPNKGVGAVGLKENADVVVLVPKPLNGLPKRPELLEAAGVPNAVFVWPKPVIKKILYLR